jgi:hypothetical protein
MENSELNQLIDLLDHPSLLHQKVVQLKSTEKKDDQIEGFIHLYDKMEGDVFKIKEYLNESKLIILKPSYKKKNTTKYIYLTIAAIFIGIIVLGIREIDFSSDEDKEISLMNEFVEPGLPNYMSAEKTICWENIMFDYKSKKFLSANSKLQKALKNDSINDTLIYYAGIINYNLKRFEKAKYNFDYIAKSNSIFTDRSTYYLGKMLYQKGRKDDSKIIFKSLINSKDLDVKNAAFEHIKQLSGKK